MDLCLRAPEHSLVRPSLLNAHEDQRAPDLSLYLWHAMRCSLLPAPCSLLPERAHCKARTLP